VSKKPQIILVVILIAIAVYLTIDYNKNYSSPGVTTIINLHNPPPQISVSRASGTIYRGDEIIAAATPAGILAINYYWDDNPSEMYVVKTNNSITIKVKSSLNLGTHVLFVRAIDTSYNSSEWTPFTYTVVQ
jgi:hypothetical protein